MIFDAIKLRFSVERFSMQIFITIAVENVGNVNRWDHEQRKSLGDFNLVSRSVSEVVFQLKSLVFDVYGRPF